MPSIKRRGDEIVNALQGSGKLSFTPVPAQKKKKELIEKTEKSRTC